MADLTLTMLNKLKLFLGLVLLLAVPLSYAQNISPDKQGQAAIEEAYQAILERYVAEIDPRKLSDAAIEGMLRELDPYSEYIYDGESNRIDDITTGEYGGVGIHLGRMNDTLIAVSPMDGTPAFLQGILAGDRIIRIDSVWTKGLRIADAAKLMRGPVGKPVTLSIKRAGDQDILEFELIREMIKVPDISYSGLLRDNVGYIRLANFTKYSGEDLERAVRKLNKLNLIGLILDVRGNPGGLLNASLMSADLFIDKGELLLETRGRVTQSKRQYYSRRNPIVRRELPVAILVDGGSASASEILSGILQDYDRAIVIGEPTYGKGLVQTITRLGPETRLKLTTAKYYLPSGRLIQKRPIAEAVLYEDLLESDASGGFYSENNREFDSGIGVQPDLEIEPLALSDFERGIWRKRLFYKYALDYKTKNPELMLPISLEDAQIDSFYQWMVSIDAFPTSSMKEWIDNGRDLVDSSAVSFQKLDELRHQLLALALEQQEEILAANRIQIINGLEIELANVIGGTGARVAASLKYDPVVQQSIDLLNSREEVLEILAGTAKPSDY
ncbi:MAG: S41 family peptidase [Candidatus Marinimicrobia bacterium]|nr:S41 family peptidase [Candidatus Neomarinimicrobiota bacterium]MCF7850050.1 S41 family peptidase [Candidatus Neomarinimicrobiota bacterium]